MQAVAASPLLRPVRPDERDGFTTLVMETLRHGDLAMAAVMRSPFLTWWARRLLHFFYHRCTRPLILEVDGTTAGFLVLRRSKETLHIEALGILPAFRRQGWGKWLLDQAVREARALGLKRLELHVSTGNRPALRLYASADFYPVPRTWHGIRMEHLLDSEGEG